jgi:Na+/H+-dicarboxylate symporter
VKNLGVKIADEPLLKMLTQNFFNSITFIMRIVPYGIFVIMTLFFWKKFEVLVLSEPNG